MNQAIRREESARKRQDRADNTRRKILDGALIQIYADTHPDIQTLLEKLRKEELTREDDRKLFGLTPLPKREEEKK